MDAFPGSVQIYGLPYKETNKSKHKKPQSIFKYTLGKLYVQYYELGSYN
jgi:hypothetical protein